ncbi:MAG TPA: hypothetical protein VNA88_14990 [Candidatus Kapabacteria bacterium]|jgi:hypothetical protein|nr:hypothetical protein [Candidatus Kapabacteria bacterium]
MRSLLLAALLAVLTAATAAAQIPRTVSFQGRARDAAGAYPDDERSMTIRVFAAATGGSSIFSETHTVRFQRGAFTIIIGGNTAGGIPERVGFDRPLWLEITITGFNGNAPLSPRLQFHSAPSAIAAITAESAAVADSLAPGSVVGAAHVVVADTLGSRTAPDPGTIYRDNTPMAWGLVAADGTLLADVGIESVTKTGNGGYDVLLDNSAVMVAVPKGRDAPAMAPMIQPSLLSDIGAPLIAQWSFRAGVPAQDRLIVVQTFVSQNGETIPTDAAFAITVFGRPAK